MAYYKLQYKANELSPAGTYFSISDLVGPGAQVLRFGTGALSPANHVSRTADDKPSDFGQWGVGLQYQLTDVTSVGAYWIRYDDTNPAVVVNTAMIPGVPVPVPTSYHIKYFDGIDVAAASFSTSLGPVNVAGEAMYRNGIDLLVNNVATRGKTTQLLVSALYTVEPNFISREIDLAGEVGYLHVNQVDPVYGSTQLTNSKNSWAYELTATAHYYNVLGSLANGWDMTVPLSFAAIAKGNPAVAGIFGSLYGEGDQRLGVGVNFIYLNNLQLGLRYAAFLGSPSLSEHPYADRDYVALTAHYSF